MSNVQGGEKRVRQRKRERGREGERLSFRE
jgi:hypothetical protein